MLPLQVIRSLPKSLWVIVKPSKAVIAIIAEKSAVLSAGVRVVYTEAKELSPPPTAFRFLANCAKPILRATQRFVRFASHPRMLCIVREFAAEH